MKKIAYLLLCFFAVSVGQLYAIGNDTITLQQDCKLIGSANLTNGLILITGKEYYYNRKLDWKLSYYTSNLVQRYEVPVPNPKLTYENLSDIIASPSGNSVYFVCRGGGGWFNGAKNKQRVVHIDTLGTTSTGIVKGQFKYSHLNAIFADDEYMYYVTKEKDRANHHRHAPRKIQFVRVAKDMTITKIWPELPQPDEDATEWSYFGHTAIVSYFVSRTIDEENRKQTYRIAVLDHNGKLQDDFKIEMALKKGGFLSGTNFTGSNGTKIVDDNSVRIVTSGYTNAAGTSYTTTHYYPNPEAFGHIMLDPMTNGFYIYGLAADGMDNKRAKRRAKRNVEPEVTNYYIYKYDQDGKPVWEYEGNLTGIDAFYREKAAFNVRNIMLAYGPGGNIRFQAFTQAHDWHTQMMRYYIFDPMPLAYNVTSYEIDPQKGKFLFNYTNTFKNEVSYVNLGQCHRAGGKRTEMSRFLSKTENKDYSFTQFRLVDANIVIKNYYTLGKLILKRFDDE